MYGILLVRTYFQRISRDGFYWLWFCSVEFWRGRFWLTGFRAIRFCGVPEVFRRMQYCCSCVAWSNRFLWKRARGFSHHELENMFWPLNILLTRMWTFSMSACRFLSATEGNFGSEHGWLFREREIGDLLKRNRLYFSRKDQNTYMCSTDYTGPKVRWPSSRGNSNLWKYMGSHLNRSLQVMWQ